MKTLIYDENLRLSGERVVALGFFDGVHLGHRDMLARARAAADERGLPLAVFTFFSESEGLKGGAGRIYDTKTRLSLLEELGVDLAVIADFGKIRTTSHEEFSDHILISQLNTALAVSGFNFRYGNGAKGNADTLVAQMRAKGRDALIVPAYLASDGEPLSSTKIKKALLDGEIEQANQYLSKPYRIASAVEAGLRIGRSYGVPTLNQSFPEGTLIPKHGVYRAALTTKNGVYHALTNIGVCPTFGERPPHAETFVLASDFEDSSDCVTVHLLGYLREERTFDSAESLKLQINIDKNEALNRNGDIQWLINGQN